MATEHPDRITFPGGIAPSRVQQFSAEAYAFELGTLSQMQAPRRYTLLLCLLQQMQVQARDSLVDVFLKRMRLIHQRAQEELDLIGEQQRETTGNLVRMLSQIVQHADEAQTNAALAGGSETSLGSRAASKPFKMPAKRFLLITTITICLCSGSFIVPTVRTCFGSSIYWICNQPTTQDITLLNALNVQN